MTNFHFVYPSFLYPERCLKKKLLALDILWKDEDRLIFDRVFNRLLMNSLVNTKTASFTEATLVEAQVALTVQILLG